jgi:hypothetical protein
MMDSEGQRHSHVYLVQMDVADDKEALFNELYEFEHIPQLSELPGVLDITRYRLLEGRQPKYLAIYWLAEPGIPKHPSWREAADRGRWRLEIRPFTSNRLHRLYGRVSGQFQVQEHLALAFIDAESWERAHQTLASKDGVELLKGESPDIAPHAILWSRATPFPAEEREMVFGLGDAATFELIPATTPPG